jgi:pyroglutamyl-peptidase
MCGRIKPRMMTAAFDFYPIPPHLGPMSAQNLRILITGFGPFPGAPYNPTPALVARLLRIRRPALADVTLTSHIFSVAYDAVDRDLPVVIAQHRPDALLMFGLAARTPHIRIETRARNAISALWPDASHVNVGRTLIAGRADAKLFGPHTRLLARAAQASGLPAALSRDAGRYLCNYLCWRGIEAVEQPNSVQLAAFVHVPLVARGSSAMQRTSRLTLDDLVVAGEQILTALVPLARRAKRASQG